MTIPGLSEAAAAVRHYQAKVTDMQYPKSLGELCLEECQARLSMRVCFLNFIHGNWGPGAYLPPPYDFDIPVPRVSEFHALRRAMWHKERT